MNKEGFGDQNFREVRHGEIKKAVLSVPAGEHWIVGKIETANITVQPGAKLTVEGDAEKCNIFKPEGAEVEIRGMLKKGRIVTGEDAEQAARDLGGRPKR